MIGCPASGSISRRAFLRGYGPRRAAVPASRAPGPDTGQVRLRHSLTRPPETTRPRREQRPLHRRISAKAAEPAAGGDDAMARRTRGAALAHDVANGAPRARPARKAGDAAIRTDPPGRNTADRVQHPRRERRRRHRRASLRTGSRRDRRLQPAEPDVGRLGRASGGGRVRVPKFAADAELPRDEIRHVNPGSRADAAAADAGRLDAGERRGVVEVGPLNSIRVAMS